MYLFIQSFGGAKNEQGVYFKSWIKYCKLLKGSGVWHWKIISSALKKCAFPKKKKREDEKYQPVLITGAGRNSAFRFFRK